MQRSIFRTTVAAPALLALPLICTAAGLTPGLYEYTTTTNFPVAPGESAQPQVMQECIAEAGLGSLEKLAPMPKDGHCRIHDKTDSEGQSSYKYSCGGPLKSEGMVAVSATTFAMNVTVFMSNGRSVTTSMTGRRIGDCRK